MPRGRGVGLSGSPRSGRVGFGAPPRLERSSGIGNEVARAPCDGQVYCRHVTAQISRPAVAPVSTAGRMLALDVLRGWAVAGMLVVNFGYCSQQGLDPRGGADAIGAPMIQLLADGKFWTLFSVLFGLGFALQLHRADARGAPFGAVYVRRLLFLFLIGVMHALLHPLEILHRYAFLGLLLLPLRRASTRALVVVGVLGLVAPPVVQSLAFGEPAPAAESARVYAEADLPELLSHNVTRFRREAIDIRVLAPLPYFVLGVYLGRQRLLENLGVHRVQLARARWWRRRRSCRRPCVP